MKQENITPTVMFTKNNKLGDFALQEVKFEFCLQKTFGETFHHSFVKDEIFRQDIF